MEHNLEIIPVINKIDLPSADIERVTQQIASDLGLDPEGALLVSAKEGIGIAELFEAIVARLPAATGDAEAPLQALIFDSHYDAYRGTVVYFRIFDGRLRAGDVIRFMSNDAAYKVEEVGIFQLRQVPAPELVAGQVGYLIAGIKTISDTRCGDTITLKERPCAEPLPGYKEIQPMVFSGIYPVDSSDYESLKTAMGKLQINDSAFRYMAESSVALGFGFRCGFLGLLHMEIVQERLRREFNMDVISTYPSVIYQVRKTDGTMLQVDNPSFLPSAAEIDEISEPIVKVNIMIPNDNIGDMMQLVMDKRGQVNNTETLDDRRVLLHTVMPLNEILVDFNDKLKSITRGYGSMDYEHAGYAPAELVKMDILIAGDPVDAFSCIVHRSKAESRGRQLCGKLKEVIPQQLFVVAIQAAIGGKIIARESISALRKDVTAKCYGGDISRKRKLLDKQKEGKKKMKAIGKVNIPQEAFIEVLKTN
jgi:GTP-binding protein LepA